MLKRIASNQQKLTLAMKTQSWTHKILARFPENKEKYDYSKVTYSNCKTKVEIGCKKCQSYFNQNPSLHGQGTGCPNRCCVKKKSKESNSMGYDCPNTKA